MLASISSENEDNLMCEEYQQQQNKLQVAEIFACNLFNWILETWLTKKGLEFLELDQVSQRVKMKTI